MNKAIYDPNIGRKIERLRILKGIKQETLARHLGVSQQTISKIEKRTMIKEEEFVKIAEALGMHPDAIKKFDEGQLLHYTANVCDQAVNAVYYSNPMDKLESLYERLMKSEIALTLERERSKQLEATVHSLELRIAELEIHSVRA